MRKTTYLDYSASAPLLAPVKVAMVEAFDLVGNASSVHQSGRIVQSKIEEARENVAALVGARPQDVIFTSGGTEANNLALTASLFPRPLQGDVQLYVSAIEHPSVLNGMRFEKDKITVIPVTEAGVIDVSWLRRQLLGNEAEPDASEDKKVSAHNSTDGTKELKPILVSVMAANNETGIVQPLAEIASIVHQAGGLLHSDCVQALGKRPLLLPMTGADLISVSAHKIGGPQGVGALILRGAEIILRAPLVAGGGQELKRRGGTENSVGIIGFGAAAKAVSNSYQKNQLECKVLRDELEQGLMEVSPDAVIFGRDVERLENICCFAVPHFSAETQVIQFDLENISLSSGAACSSGKVEHSHVLKAMGVGDELSYAALRISLGIETKSEDINIFLQAWKEIYTRTKARGHAA